MRAPKGAGAGCSGPMYIQARTFCFTAPAGLHCPATDLLKRVETCPIQIQFKALQDVFYHDDKFT